MHADYLLEYLRRRGIDTTPHLVLETETSGIENNVQAVVGLLDPSWDRVAVILSHYLVPRLAAMAASHAEEWTPRLAYPPAKWVLRVLASGVSDDDISDAYHPDDPVKQQALWQRRTVEAYGQYAWTRGTYRSGLLDNQPPPAQNRTGPNRIRTQRRPTGERQPQDHRRHATPRRRVPAGHG